MAGVGTSASGWAQLGGYPFAWRMALVTRPLSPPICGRSSMDEDEDEEWMKVDETAGAHNEAGAGTNPKVGFAAVPAILHPIVVILVVAVQDRPKIGGLNGLETKACLHENRQPASGVQPLVDVPTPAIEPMLRRDAVVNDEITDLVQVACGGQESALLAAELAHPAVRSRNSP